MSVIERLFDEAQRKGMAYIAQASGSVGQNEKVDILLIPAKGHRIVIGKVSINSAADSLKLHCYSAAKGSESGGNELSLYNVNREFKAKKLITAMSGSTVANESLDISFEIIGLSDNKNVTAPASGDRNGVTCICPSNEIVRFELENLDSTSRKLAFSFSVFAVPEVGSYPNWNS